MLKETFNLIITYCSIEDNKKTNISNLNDIKLQDLIKNVLSDRYKRIIIALI